jgi:hypothetical protein
LLLKLGRSGFSAVNGPAARADLVYRRRILDAALRGDRSRHSRDVANSMALATDREDAATV